MTPNKQSTIQVGDRQFELEIERANQQFREKISNRLQLHIEEKKKYASRLERFADAASEKICDFSVNGTIKKLHVQTIGGVVKPGVDLLDVVPLN